MADEQNPNLDRDLEPDPQGDSELVPNRLLPSRWYESTAHLLQQGRSPEVQERLHWARRHVVNPRERLVDDPEYMEFFRQYAQMTAPDQN